MKIKNKKTRKKTTWSFQPDDDVRKLVEDNVGNLSRGEKTALINEAIRVRHAAAAISLAEKRVAEAQSHLENLKRIAAGKGL
jgi:hypothetical protein